LRGEVVDERRGFDAVQLELAERVREDLGDRAGRQSAAVPRAIDPITDDAALQALGDDAEEIDRPCDRAVVEDRERMVSLSSCRWSRRRWPSAVKNAGG
jgi:hypothetical protein